MQLPANLEIVGVQLATAAVAHTDATQTVVPSPGAGARRRIWMVQFSANSTALAAHLYRALFFDPAGAIDNSIRCTNNYPVTETISIPGGWLITSGQALRVQYRASIAGPLFYHATAYYTTEEV